MRALFAMGDAVLALAAVQLVAAALVAAALAALRRARDGSRA
jgi:hypothetical protein